MRQVRPSLCLPPSSQMLDMDRQDIDHHVRMLCKDVRALKQEMTSMAARQVALQGQQEQMVQVGTGGNGRSLQVDPLARVGGRARELQTLHVR